MLAVLVGVLVSLSPATDITVPDPPTYPTYVVNPDGSRTDCAPGYASCNWRERGERG